MQGKMKQREEGRLLFILSQGKITRFSPSEPGHDLIEHSFGFHLNLLFGLILDWMQHV